MMNTIMEKSPWEKIKRVTHLLEDPTPLIVGRMERINRKIQVILDTYCIQSSEKRIHKHNINGVK
jgi:hypothetical protein